MSLSPMPSTFRRVRRIDGHHTGTYVRTVHGGQGFKRWTAARILRAAAMDATEVRASARGSMSLWKCRRPCTVHGGKRFHWLSATLIGNAVVRTFSRREPVDRGKVESRNFWKFRGACIWRPFDARFIGNAMPCRCELVLEASSGA